MKKNLFKATTLALTAFVVSACNLVGNLGTLAMDSEDAVKKVKKLVTDNIDTGEWKIIGLSWNEGGGNGQLANDLNSGFVSVNMVKKDDGREYSQSFIGQLHYKPTAPDPNTRRDTPLEYDKITPIDVAKLDPAAIVSQLEEAKKMLPEQYVFKSLASYEMDATVPSEITGRGEYSDQQTAEFVMNVVEKGKETVTSAGQTSIVYYEVTFEVAPDGTLTMQTD